MSLEDENGSYRVLRLSIDRCLPLMNAMPTRSRGPFAGRAGMIRRSVFENEGELVGIVTIREPEFE